MNGNKKINTFREFLRGKLFMVLALIFLQIVLPIIFVFVLSVKYSAVVYISFSISLVLSVLIISSDKQSDFKILWVLGAFVFPYFTLYLYIVSNIFSFNAKKNSDYTRYGLGLKKHMLKRVCGGDSLFDKTADYIYNELGYADSNADVKYFESGEKYFGELTKDILKAERFIFIESFIIKKGKMCSSLCETLFQKLSGGVEVRIIYDACGSSNSFPVEEFDKLEGLGAKIYKFNPVHPVLDTRFNYRNHRKIVVIDGKIGYMGGVNIGDEYINEQRRLGYFKDCALKIKGRTVSNLSAMFLQLWDCEYGSEESADYFPPLPASRSEDKAVIYSDSPKMNYSHQKNIYLNAIYNAKSSVYITAPYLIIDNALFDALCFKAKTGVEIRIIIPEIPDKKAVYALTLDCAEKLSGSGVFVCLYKGGFIHSKSLVIDGELSVLGSANMDFRSYYLHFECGAVISSKEISNRIIGDFRSSEAVGEKIGNKNKKTGFFKNIYLRILKLFAPLM